LACHWRRCSKDIAPGAKSTWAASLIDRTVATLEARRPPTTVSQYRRALARFREFVGARRALEASSWSAAADRFLAALRDKSWPAFSSFYVMARSSLGHLQRAERSQ
jgi:hypothetical protein